MSKRADPTWIMAIDPGDPFGVAWHDRSKIRPPSHSPAQKRGATSFPFSSPREAIDKMRALMKEHDLHRDGFLPAAAAVIEGTYKGEMGHEELATLNMRIGAIWTFFSVLGAEVFLASVAYGEGGGGWKHDLDLMETGRSRSIREALGVDGRSAEDEIRVAESRTGLEGLRNEHEADAALLLSWFEIRILAGDMRKLKRL